MTYFLIISFWSVLTYFFPFKVWIAILAKRLTSKLMYFIFPLRENPAKAKLHYCAAACGVHTEKKRCRDERNTWAAAVKMQHMVPEPQWSDASSMSLFMINSKYINKWIYIYIYVYFVYTLSCSKFRLVGVPRNWGNLIEYADLSRATHFPCNLALPHYLTNCVL